jgi:hypothetical protein
MGLFCRCHRDAAVDTIRRPHPAHQGAAQCPGDPCPRVIQCVQHVNYPYTRLDAWPEQAPYNDRKSRLVFIVRDLEQSVVEKIFAMFCGVMDLPPEPEVSSAW